MTWHRLLDILWRLKHTVRKQPPTTKEERQSGAEENRDPDILRTIKEISDRAFNEYQAYQEQHRRDSCINRTIAIAAVVVAFGYTTVAILQWRELLRSNGLTRQTLNETKRSNELAERNIGLAERSLNASIESYRLDQRAWMGIGKLEAVPLVPEAGKPLRIEVTFRNTGKTPAKNIRGASVVDPALNRRPNFSYSADAIFRYGLMSPGGEGHATLRPVRSRSTGQERPLTTELLDALRADAIRAGAPPV